MKSLLYILSMLLLANGLFAQKCKDSLLVLHREIDSMKVHLAEARREWQKCSEQSSSASIIMSERQKFLESEYQKLLQINDMVKVKTQNLSDSLRKTVAAAALLQKTLAEKELKEQLPINSANALIQKLNDSLAAYISPQFYVFGDKGDVFIYIGDSLLLGGYFYVSPSGKQILEKINQLILPEIDRKLNICAYANADARKQELWKQSNLKATAVLSVFEQLKYPVERLSMQAFGNWNGKVNYQRPPIMLELKLN